MRQGDRATIFLEEWNFSWRSPRTSEAYKVNANLPVQLQLYNLKEKKFRWIHSNFCFCTFQFFFFSRLVVAMKNWTNMFCHILYRFGPGKIGPLAGNHFMRGKFKASWEAQNLESNLNLPWNISKAAFTRVSIEIWQIGDVHWSLKELLKQHFTLRAEYRDWGLLNILLDKNIS